MCRSVAGHRSGGRGSARSGRRPVRVGTVWRVSNYWELPGLADLHLEDSWVREVSVSEGAVAFILDLVLREGHPSWRPPMPGERHCYRRSILRFDEAHAIVVRPSGLPPAIDANGETDLGHIDVMTLDDDGYHLEGDWGTVVVDSPQPTLTIH